MKKIACKGNRVKQLILSYLLTTNLQEKCVIRRAYLPIQNFEKMFSRRSSVDTWPVMLPK